MRILLLSNYYPPFELGGMEQLTCEAATGLKARGHHVSVLTSHVGVEPGESGTYGILRSLFPEAEVNYYHPRDFFMRRPRQERTNRRVLRNALHTLQPDVVFIWGMWNLSPQLAYWAEQWCPGRVAYCVASYWLMEPTTHEAYWKKPSGYRLTRALMAPARWWALRTLARERKAYPLALEEVSCVSEYVRRELSAAGVLPNHARVIYNGIDPEPFLQAQKGRSAHREDPLRLAYVGQLLPHKGVHTAIEALGLLRQSDIGCDLALTIVGGGHPDYEEELKTRVKALGLEDQVTFHGRVPREEIPALLAESDLFLFTSIWAEPIARTVMEAMAAGVAVIGTPVGGQREMLEDGVNALVFSPENADELAACVLRLQRDPALRRRLADAGQQTVLERFTMERMVDEIEAWLVKIAEVG